MHPLRVQDFADATWEHDLIVRGRHLSVGDEYPAQKPIVMPDPRDWRLGADVAPVVDLDGDGKADKDYDNDGIPDP